MSDTPEPCPFCGSTNGTDEQGETYRWRLWRCNDCGACGPEERCQITGASRADSAAASEARDIALRAWNRRPQTADAVTHALERAIDLVAFHGGPVQLEAAIRSLISSPPAEHLKGPL